MSRIKSPATAPFIAPVGPKPRACFARNRIVAPGVARGAARLLLIVFVASASSALRAAEFTFTVSDQTKAPVADAVVALYPVGPRDASALPGRPPAPLEIEQRNTEFAPLVTAVQAGGSVLLPNREDKVKHHVYSASAPKRFELPLYAPGKAETVVFDKPGLVVLGCNIHDWMLAYVLVVDTPCFAKTGADGRAVVFAPPGEWRAEIWHPRLKDAVKSGPAAALRRDLTLTAESAATPQAFSLTLEADKRVRRGPVIKGGGYK